MLTACMYVYMLKVHIHYKWDDIVLEDMTGWFEVMGVITISYNWTACDNWRRMSEIFRGVCVKSLII